MSPTKPRIERLTAEQEAALPAWRHEWLQQGLVTAHADRPRAEAALTAMYAAINEAAPHFLWVDSPATACLAHAVFKNVKSLRPEAARELRASLRDSLRASLWDSLGDSLRTSLWDSLWDSFGDSLRASLWDSLRASLGDSLRASLGDSLRASLRASLWDSLWASLGDSLRDSLRASLGDSLGRFLGWGSWEWWVPFYLYPRDVLGVEYDAKRSAQLDAWAELMRSCGWWMPFKGMVIVCERPAVIARDERGRLHCEDGPALAFRDGYSVWAWHGVRVPQQVVEQHETLTVDQVLGEQNAEVRRVMIERFGAEHLMAAGKGTVVHKDDWGTLWRIPLPGDEPIVMVEVVNSSPELERDEHGELWFKHYWLRVPPTVQTARQAVLWTHDLPADAEALAMT